MENLFTRVTKYVPSEGANPRENRLTEIFAAVMELVPGLPQRMLRVLTNAAPEDDSLIAPVRAVLGAAPEHEVQVRTQRLTPSGWNVDLAPTRPSGSRSSMAPTCTRTNSRTTSTT